MDDRNWVEILNKTLRSKLRGKVIYKIQPSPRNGRNVDELLDSENNILGFYYFNSVAHQKTYFNFQESRFLRDLN